MSAGPALALHLHQRAAHEVDAEIQPVEEIQRDREDRQQRRNRKADAAEAHEVEFGVVGDDAKRRQHAECFDHGQYGMSMPSEMRRLSHGQLR